MNRDRNFYIKIITALIIVIGIAIMMNTNRGMNISPENNPPSFQD